MLQIGITGGMACGKSTVMEYIRSLGHTVFSSDEAFKSIFDTDIVQDWLKEQIIIRKGIEGLTEYQDVGKTLIRYFMLSDQKFKSDYESLVHPLVRQAMLVADADVSEVPLLFETGGKSHFRHIWVIACAPEVQIARLMGRMQCNREYALTWINNQMPLQEKIELANRVIFTDEPVHQIFEIVKQALSEDLSGNMTTKISEHKINTCSRKVKYDNVKEAHKARKNMISKLGDAGRKLQIYNCIVCNKYHLGKPTKKHLQIQKLNKQKEQIDALAIVNSDMSLEIQTQEGCVFP